MNTGVEPVVSDAAAEGFILALLGMLGTVIVLCLVWWIISVIAGWKVFTKAG